MTSARFRFERYLSFSAILCLLIGSRMVFAPLLLPMERALGLTHAVATSFFLAISIGYSATLLPSGFDPKNASPREHFAAFGLEMVLENLDRLEVRGRDSAGLGVHLVLPPHAARQALPEVLAREYAERAAIENAGDGSVRAFTLPDGQFVDEAVARRARGVVALAAALEETSS